MRFYSTLLAVAPLLMTATADMDFDLNDAPSVCRDTCRPIADLANRCNTDLRGDDNDRQEDLLEAQCFCTNSSFDVEATSALCLDCIRQNFNSTSNPNDDDDDHDHDDHHQGEDDWDDDHDHDDHHNSRKAKRDHDGDDNDDHDDAWDDINRIVRTCSFSSTTWSPSSTSATRTVSVSADRPTDASQLTTTFTAAPQTDGGNSPIQTNPPNTDNTDDNSNTNTNSGDDNDGAAAGIAAPIFMAGALVAGAVAMLA